MFPDAFYQLESHLHWSTVALLLQACSLFLVQSTLKKLDRGVSCSHLSLLEMTVSFTVPSANCLEGQYDATSHSCGPA